VKRFFTIITFIAQLLLSISPFFKLVRNNIWAPQTSVSSFASTLASYIGVDLLLLSLLVYLLLADFKDKTKMQIGAFESLLTRYTPLTVTRLKENEFYKDFLGCCLKANHYVSICYFAPRPPQDGAPAERDEYYKTMIRVMRGNPDTQFRRIIRDTPPNREWAKQLVYDLRKTTNCSIRMLRDLDQSEDMPLALSVQIVDGTKAWLVAVAEHGSAPVYRDLGIENLDVVEMLNKYFDRLWKMGRVVFEPGFDEVRSNQAIDGGH
jgi:hypothetical protein